MLDLPRSLAERIRATPRAPSPTGRFVLYWMRAALRATDNPALDTALALGHSLGLPVFVYRALSDRTPYANARHHTFLLEGHRVVERDLRARGIGTAFHLERPGDRRPHLRTLGEQAAVVVTEDQPVEPLRGWTRSLARVLAAPVWCVDTAAVAPIPVVGRAFLRASPFREVAAPLQATRLALPWLDREPASPSFVPELPFEPVDLATADLSALVASTGVDPTVGPVPELPGGSDAARERWARFRDEGLSRYAADRNDPLRDGVSRMSPYLHHGMISAQVIAREAREEGSAGSRKYLDELLVWRELSHHWCAHTEVHDTLDALPPWARETLLRHEADPRPALHDRETLARGRTGDPWWDLAQRSLLVHGELHNNVRMTWAKAFLGYTRTAADALAVTIDLNHRYALDGRDPSSYGGILWAYGLFDRPFSPELPVTGTVRPRPTTDHARRLPTDAWARRIGRPLVARLPTVAVIGGGPAGALAARTLVDHGLSVTVFDKGKGAGGRLSNRRVDGVRFEHGASDLTFRDPHLQRLAATWVERGLLAPWDAPFGRWVDGRFEPVALARRYVGVPTMSALVKHLLADVDVRFGVRVEALSRVDGQLRVHTTAGVSDYDHVIVTVPGAQAVPLLADVAPSLAAAMATAVVDPCWAVMVQPIVEPPLSFGEVRLPDGTRVVREQTRPGRPSAPAWTVHASAAWSTEHLEDDAPDVVAAWLLRLRDTFGLDGIHHAEAHRWRYAQVREPIGVPCLSDQGVLVAGDHLLGGRVEDALRSGAWAAGHVLLGLGAQGRTDPAR